MLNNTLSSGEVKNASAANEVFEQIRMLDNKRVFRNISYPAGQPCDLTIGHQEIGDGIAKRRRSVIRFDKTFVGGVDATKLATVSAYVVLDSPIGNFSTNTYPKEVIAHVMQLLASDGVGGVAIVHDCTGKGAQTLLNGTY